MRAEGLPSAAEEDRDGGARVESIASDEGLPTFYVSYLADLMIGHEQPKMLAGCRRYKGVEWEAKQAELWCG